MQFAMPDVTVVSARLLCAGAPCKTPPAYVFQPTPGADANHKRFTLAYLTLAIVMPCPDATGAAMTNAVDALSTQATQLPPAERLEVVERILDSPIELVTVTNTIPQRPATDIPNIRYVSVAELIAEAIRRNHQGISISSLFR